MVELSLWYNIVNEDWMIPLGLTSLDVERQTRRMKNSCVQTHRGKMFLDIWSA